MLKAAAALFLLSAPLLMADPGDEAVLDTQTLAARLYVTAAAFDGPELTGVELAWLPASVEEGCRGLSLRECRLLKPAAGSAPTRVLTGWVTKHDRSAESRPALAVLGKRLPGRAEGWRNRSLELQHPTVQLARSVKGRITWERWTNGENFRLRNLVDAAPEPEAGDYIFSLSHGVEVCRRFDPERFCIESDRRAFGFGEKIHVKEFTGDEKAGGWSAKVSALGRSHAIPMSVLHKHSACDKLMDGYRMGLSRAPRDCKRDSDCSLFPSPWNSCLPPQAARSSRKLDALLEKLLAAIPGGGCLLLHPPCAAVPPGEARCVKSSCENVSIGFGLGRFRNKAGQIEGAIGDAQSLESTQPPASPD